MSVDVPKKGRKFQKHLARHFVHITQTPKEIILCLSMNRKKGKKLKRLVARHLVSSSCSKVNIIALRFTN